MPKLSDSMEEGLIVTWLIEEGQSFDVGDELVEIETDKAAMTYESETAGVLEILVAEGETAEVGVAIARALAADSAPEVAEADALEAKTSESAPEGPAPESEDDDSPADEVTAAAPPEQPPVITGGRASTPLARRAAAIHGISLEAVQGSGPAGRVTKGDVLRAAGVESAAGSAPREEPAPKAAPVPAPSAPSGQSGEGAKGATTIVELSRLQTVIAKRMAQAKATVPEFQVETEVRMDAAAELRGSLKEAAAERVVPSFNDMIVKAAATALRNHPRANASYEDGRFAFHERINIGVAVAADDALVVPTVADANVKSLGQIAAETRRLAGRVRSGEITPPELSGGTFTVSNLGMFGMTAISPVINLPQAAILGVGAMRQTLLRDESGEIVDASMMTLSLTCDHRILYGADASRFLAEIKEYLEAPVGLLL